MLRFLNILSIAVLPLSVFAEEKFFDSNGVQIHYYDRGSGEPVVLMHGFSGSAAIWDTLGFTDALIEAGYRVIAFDARGHGKSGKPHDPAQYGMEMSDDIGRLLDHMDINKAHIVGYSMGAVFAHSFRATHPDRLLTAVLGGGGPTSEESIQRLKSVVDIDAIARGALGPDLFVAPPGEQPPSQEQIDAMNKIRSNNDSQALAALLRTDWSWMVDTVEELRSNEVPTLAIIGEKDQNKKDLDAVSDDMANLEVFVIPGANHLYGLLGPALREETMKFLAKKR